MAHVQQTWDTPDITILAITENGWAAQDLVIPAFNVNVPSNATFQRTYASRMLTESEQLDMEFVIWWAHVDFDAFWDGALLQDPVARIWRDIGLVDENLVDRPALSVWQEWYARPRQ